MTDFLQPWLSTDVRGMRRQRQPTTNDKKLETTLLPLHSVGGALECVQLYGVFPKQVLNHFQRLLAPWRREGGVEGGHVVGGEDQIGGLAVFGDAFGRAGLRDDDDVRA